MFEIPGLDLKAMSDDDLLTRLVDVSKKIAWASRSGAAYPIDHLRQIMQAINAEQSERMFMIIWNKMKSKTDTVIDTDPDTNSKNVAVAEKKSHPKMARRLIPTATRSPIIPTDPLKTIFPKDENNE